MKIFLDMANVAQIADGVAHEASIDRNGTGEVPERLGESRTRRRLALSQFGRRARVPIGLSHRE